MLFGNRAKVLEVRCDSSIVSTTGLLDDAGACSWRMSRLADASIAPAIIDPSDRLLLSDCTRRAQEISN